MTTSQSAGAAGSGATGGSATSTPIGVEAAARLLAGVLHQPPVVGEFVGGFELLERLGQGGFAEVFRGRQREPVEREVAVKVLRTAERRVEVDRFERELRALARLRHPGIVRLLEAGVTPSGHAWFAMDLVTGRTIDRWSDEAATDLASRLAILEQLAAAVAAAHRQGVLHRDLKPANVLVSEGSEGPQVHVVDFGIARLVHEEPGDLGVERTRAGQVIGTPEYMSPEAASLEPDRVDTRSDVYSLGLIAFRVLAGVRAIDAPTGTSFASRLRLAASPQIDRVSAACRDRAMARRLRGEIDWIVAKCLSLDPAARYASAAELAEDLTRLRRREPLLATPAGLGHQLRSLARRHRAAAIFVGASVAVLLAATAVVAVFALGEARARAAAEDARGIAERERVRAEEALDAESRRTEELRQVVAFEESRLREIDVAGLGLDLRRDLLRQAEALEPVFPGRRGALEEQLAGVDFTDAARRMLDGRLLATAAESVVEEFPRQPLVQARLLDAIARSYLAIGLAEPARATVARAEAILASIPAPPEEDRLKLRETLALSLGGLGRSGEARELAAAAAEEAARRLGAEHRVTLGLRLVLAGADVGGDAASMERSLAIYGEVEDKLRRLDPPDERLALRVAGERAQILEDLGRLPEALALRRSLETRILEVLDPHDPVTLSARANLAALLEASGDLEAALAAHEELQPLMVETLGGEHPLVMQTESDFAVLLGKLGQLERADALQTEVLAARLRVLGEIHPDTLSSIGNLAVLKRRRNDLAAAEVLTRDAVRLAEIVHGPTHRQTLTFRANLGAVLQAAGRSEEAIELLQRTRADAVASLGAEHPVAISLLGNLAVTLNQQGRTEEALPLFEEVARVSERVNGVDASTTIGALANLGGLLRTAGRLEESLAMSDEALLRARRSMTPGQWNIGAFLVFRARTLADLGRLEEATATLEEANEILEAALGPRHPRAIECRQAIIGVLEQRLAAEPSAGHEVAIERWRGTLTEAP